MYIKKEFGYWMCYGKDMTQILFCEKLYNLFNLAKMDVTTSSDGDHCVKGSTIEQQQFLDTLFDLLQRGLVAKYPMSSLH
jgi:hypothetical protein